MNLDDLLWKNMQRAAAGRTMRDQVRKKVEAKYKREHRNASYAMRVESDAAKQPLPEDTRSLTARVMGDPIPNDPRRQRG